MITFPIEFFGWYEFVSRPNLGVAPRRNIVQIKTVIFLALCVSTGKSKCLFIPYQEFIMSIRKSIAAGLIVAANAVAKDQSKERIQKWVHDSRVKLAKVIEPKGWSV